MVKPATFFLINSLFAADVALKKNNQSIKHSFLWELLKKGLNSYREVKRRNSLRVQYEMHVHIFCAKRDILRCTNHIRTPEKLKCSRFYKQVPDLGYNFS